MAKPAPETYPPYFRKYVDLVPEDDLIAGFKNQQPVIEALLHSISEEKSTYAYEPGKWTLKELLLHMTDAERIFNFRALCIARGETASLPGFDEDLYASNSNAGERSWQNLVDEFLAVRKSTQYLYESFSEAVRGRSGISNNNPATVNSFGFITLGHVYHHNNIIQERYLA